MEKVWLFSVHSLYWESEVEIYLSFSMQKIWWIKLIPLSRFLIHFLSEMYWKKLLSSNSFAQQRVHTECRTKVADQKRISLHHGDPGFCKRRGPTPRETLIVWPIFPSPDRTWTVRTPSPWTNWKHYLPARVHAGVTNASQKRRADKISWFFCPLLHTKFDNILRNTLMLFKFMPPNYQF